MSEAFELITNFDGVAINKVNETHEKGTSNDLYLVDAPNRLSK
jgi:hypothetical protein